MIKILLQTTIPATDDDWSIARFSRLAMLLRDERDTSDRPVFDVTARDRGPLGQPDAVLSTIDERNSMRSGYSRWTLETD